MNIWVVGIFDLFSVSDINTFKQIKEKYPDSTITVGIFKDDDLIRNNIPVLIKGPYRKMNIEHFKTIEKVVYPLPFNLTKDYLMDNKIDLIVNYQINSQSLLHEQIFNEIEKSACFEQFPRSNGTTHLDIISRVLANFDEYVLRNLNRGVTRQQLNISYFTEIRIRLQFAFSKICSCKKRKQSNKKIQ